MQRRIKRRIRKLPGIGSVLKESWDLVYGIKMPVFCLLLLNWLVIYGVKSASKSIHNHWVTLFLNASASFISLSVLLTLVILGIRRSISLNLNMRTSFKISACVTSKFILPMLIIYLVFCLEYFLIPFMNSISIDWIEGIVIALLIGLHFYIGILWYAHVVPLMMIKKIKMREAIKKGMAMMKVYGIKLFFAYFIMTTFLLLSALPLGIGLLWTVPMFWVMNGIWFREIYRLQRNIS